MKYAETETYNELSETLQGLRKHLMERKWKKMEEEKTKEKES